MIVSSRLLDTKSLQWCTSVKHADDCRKIIIGWWRIKTMSRFLPGNAKHDGQQLPNAA